MACSRVAWSVLLAVLLQVQPAAAQAPPQAAASGPQPSTTTWFVRNWTRVETWRFFEPPPVPGNGDPDYTFVANRLQTGFRHVAARFELSGALQYVQFGGLPTDAFGPGALGTGGLYYDHSHDTFSSQIYLKSLQLRFEPAAGVAVTLGRAGYTSGAESASGVPAIETIKRQRLDSRLLGDFEWSLYQRAYDGVRLDVDRSGWHLAAGAFMPTQGGFEESANATMRDILLVTAAVGVKPAILGRHTEVQAFTYRYDDDRDVQARPDNLGLPASAVPRVDIGLTTLGGSLVGVYPAGPGEVEALAWGAWQTGDWYGQAHRASSFAAEGGYRWTQAPWQPWIRGGIDRASGDSDAADAEHGTFFQVLPTGRKYSQSTAYAVMNVRDVFAQALFKPHPRLAMRLDWHRVDLAEAADRWYSGSGATRSQGTFFGYATRPSHGSRRLGTVLEGSADVTIAGTWSMNGYFGTLEGGRVVSGTFPSDRLIFFYVENVLSF